MLNGSRASIPPIGGTRWLWASLLVLPADAYEALAFTHSDRSRTRRVSEPHHLFVCLKANHSMDILVEMSLRFSLGSENPLGIAS